MDWVKGTVIEKDGKKLIWDFEFKMRKKTTARRPDLILEDNERKKIWILDMACPMEINLDEKKKEKVNKYQQLMFEIRERRKGYKVICIPVVIGNLGGGINVVRKKITELFYDDVRLRDSVVMEMSKTVVFESESILRKVLSGLVYDGR